MSQRAHELHQSAISAAQRGERERALDLIDQAIAIEPGDAGKQRDRALILMMLERLPEALASCERALELEPDSWEGLMRRGNLLSELGRIDAALASYDQAVRVAPRNAQVHYNRGVTMLKAERWSEALESFDRTIGLDPRRLDALLNRGFVLEKLRRFDGALSSYDAAISIDPRSATVHSNRGNALRELERLPEALASLERALALDPNHVRAHINRGVVLSDLDRFEEALASFQRAIDLQGDSAQAHYLRGTALVRAGNFDAAIQSYEQAIRLEPGYADAHEALSFALLITGKLERGWVEHEWRRTRRNLGARGTARAWLGQESVAGKVVLLRCEAGIGDTLQFCRYAPMVADLGARVILEVQKSLSGLLHQMPGVDTIIERGDSSVAADYYCSLMSLPVVFGTRLDSIPARTRYVQSDPEAVARWRARLGQHDRFRVGVAFSGNPEHLNDAHRSIPLAQLMRHMPREIEFHSLQMDVRPTDRPTLTASQGIVDHAADVVGMSATAALCECMDVILSVDTSIAHLAAAIGKRVWLLLPQVGLDWRWLLSRDDSPWYPSMRLYRQEFPGNWEPVLRRVAKDLTSARLTDGL